MNEEHLTLCTSSEWAHAVREWILPWTLEGFELGEQVVEIGPGPGVTTELLIERASHLTAVEIDESLAADLRRRFADRTDIDILCADGAHTGLTAGQYDSVICMTMLHHVASPRAQDAVFTEARRLLSPTGAFLGSDSLDGPEFRALHENDVCVPVAPEELDTRLRRAGFRWVEVDTNEWSVRFRAQP